MGENGSAINQFNYPVDVKISHDDKVYVAGGGNYHVQIFHSDWTIRMLLMVGNQVMVISLVLMVLLLTCLPNVHVYDSSSVIVFSSSG